MNNSPRSSCRLILFVVSLLLFGACTEQKQTNSSNQSARERVAGTRGGSLTYRLSEPTTTFNPVMARREADFIVSFYLTGGRLIEFNHDTRQWVSGLAESWRLLDDGRTVEMTLRDGLKFSDDQPLTSADVEFSMRAYYGVKDSTIGSSLKIDGRPIEVRAHDARRVDFVFPEQVAAPESQLVNIVVLPRHALENDFAVGDATEESGQGNANQSPAQAPRKRSIAEAYGVTTDPKSIVTSGAFAFEEVAPGERITLRRNPHYWKKDSAGTQLPYLDQFKIEIVADSDAALARLQEGNLDIVDRIRATDYATLSGQGGRARAENLGPGLSTDHLVFNLKESGGKANPVRQAWFKDARFRRAVSHAIDRESVAAGTLQGLATALYNFVPPSHNLVAADAPRTEHNLERARALLAEAGFTTRGEGAAAELFDGQNNRVEFTLIVPQENEPRKLTAAAILDDLAKVGIKVTVAPVSTSDVRARISQSFDYDAALFGTTITDFDPYSYSVLLSSNSPEHQWNPQQATPATDWEARLDELTGRLARERNADARREAFREIQILMAEQMPLVPLVARHVLCAATQRIGNYRPSPVVPYSLWNVEELFVKK